MYYVLREGKRQVGRYGYGRCMLCAENTSSKISEQLLLLFSNGVVLVAWGFGDLVEPADVHIAAEVGHPGGRDASLEDRLPVDAPEPLVVLDRLAVL
jgi:hypothetical protein